MPAAVEAQAELADELFVEALEVPLVGMLVFGREFVEEAAEDSADVVLEDELALVDAFEQLAAQAVDGFALLVHDVVVLEQVFARFEVLRFDGFLRGLDAVGDHASTRWARLLPCRGARAAC